MFITVAEQVIILFVLMFIGFLFAKLKVLSDTGIKNMTDLVLYLVTPCIMIKSFMREFDRNTLKALLISLGAAVLSHFIFIILSTLLLRSKDISRQTVLRFSAIFSNCGFMSLPLLEALLGEDGVFFGSSYIAIFNLFIWSYGIFIMGGGKSSITFKKIILSPGIIGFALSMIVFLCSIKLPDIIYQPISYMAGLNTPIPMIIIGYHLAQSNLLKGLKDLNCLFAIFLKLFVFPLIIMFTMYFCGIRGTLLLSITISASAPTAAMSTMFSSKYNRDTELSVTMVSLSTLLSLVSMPLVITLAQFFAK